MSATRSTSDNLTHERWLQFAPTVLGSAATIIGVLVINGWIFDIAILKSLHPSFVSMKSNTAVGLTLIGVSLTLLGAFPNQKISRVVAGSFSSIALLIGAISLAQYIFAVDFGFDQLLFREAPGGTETFVPGRMALITCLCFMMAGAALHMISVDYRKLRLLPDLFLSATAMTSIFVLLGYGYDDATLRQLGFYGSMAVHTALAFLMITSGGLMLFPSQRITAPIFRKTAVGSMLRWVLPASVLIPVLVGWLRMAGERAGLYGTGVGVSLSVVMTITLLLALALIGGSLLDRSQNRTREVERQARDNDQRLRALLDNSRVSVHINDLNGQLIFANRQFEEIFNVAPTNSKEQKAADTFGDKLAVRSFRRPRL